MIDTEIQEKAEEIAAKYNTMKYGLGSVRKYSIIEWTQELDKFLAPIDEPDKTKVREKFLSLVGLDGDRGLAHDKFSRDFRG
jgi:hypothetical protein